MISPLRYLPFRDLGSPGHPGRDALAGVAVAVLAVPQGVAYAVLAGLPPAMGLYAAVTPAIVGSLFRSSRHVVTGPTNAVSLLVGTATASLAVGGDPVQLALTLALLVGLLQLGAGLLNLGALVDFISSPVVLGYITGAGFLIAVGQLPNVTGTPGGGEHLPGQVVAWVSGLRALDPRAVALALGTGLVLVALRRVAPRAPGSVIVMAAGIGLSWAFDLQGHGMRVVRDIAPVPAGLPPLTLPAVGDAWALMPMAVAVTVLSLVESTSAARSLARDSGQRLDPSVEFAGQGLANIASSLTGGYPVSGSLARSALSVRSGADSRIAGIVSGLGVLTVLLVAAPLVDLTPVATLAGILLVIAVDLVDREQIRAILRSRPSDYLAFLATLGGTFVLPLDKAIYLGVAISLGMFLRRARLLVIREIGIDEHGKLREATPGDPEIRRCTSVRVLHVEGALFFAAANELRAVLERASAEPEVRVLVVRLKRTRGLDYTMAHALEDIHARMAKEERHLLLVGLRPDMVEVMKRVGAASEFGEDIYPTQPGWFVAMHEALAQAHELAGEHDPACPVGAWLDQGPPVVVDPT